jgi:hypothetical protein
MASLARATLLGQIPSAGKARILARPSAQVRAERPSKVPSRSATAVIIRLRQALVTLIRPL